MSAPPSQAPKPRAVPPDLLPWAVAQLAEPDPGAKLVPVAGDASNRRYFRLRVRRGSVIVLEAPPATEKNTAFLAVQRALEAGGVRVPRVLAADLDRGYLLLEDLGDRLLLPELDTRTADGWYAAALDVMARLARVSPQAARVPDYDAGLLEEELGRLPEWFLQRLLGLELTGADRALLESVSEVLVGNALEQPRVLVHRDFHSRNLMPQADGALAVIDFQDTVYGPVTYDLVSLLRDCYIRWPVARVEGWALRYRAQLQDAGLMAPVSEARFLCWFDLMGLQRHLKVLGTFARLSLRDGKADYLGDLPLVMAYVEEVVERRAGEVPALAALGDWWRERVRPRLAQQAWATRS
ncbi:aminoglycoside phosphotransferase family protein [Parahaliea mediterranea]|uniref:Phosphotransferase n=1 Tax=Parahaliea mediterranea TaxID=651086 RepID=A0A939DGN3_9GAMM|nr:phosphotransferase [Parahaliea mediterranea]MBN7797770.1 phosphotransferase [Parahaliea mediterranea]